MTDKTDLPLCPACGGLTSMQRDRSIFHGQVYPDYPNQSHGFRLECEGECHSMTCWWHTEDEAIKAWSLLDTKHIIEQAYDEAVRLATFMWEEYYKEVAPEWEPLDNVSGVLSQIDNMVAGLPQRFIERNASIREAIRSLERKRVVIEVLGIIDFIPEFPGPSIPTYKDAIKQAIRDSLK